MNLAQDNLTKKSPGPWDLTQGHRLRYALAMVALGLGGLVTFGVPFVSKVAIDAILDEETSTGRTWLDNIARLNFGSTSEANRLWAAASCIVILTVISGVFWYLRGRWVALASEGIVRQIRDHVYSHLERLPCAFYDRADTGDLIQRCTSDVETIRVFLAAQVVAIGRAVLLLVAVLPIMLWLDVSMTLLSLALFPFIIAFSVIFFRKVQAVFLRADEAEGEMTAVLQENLTGIRVVRAFARQEFEREKFAVNNSHFRDASYRLLRLLGVYWGLSDFLCLSQIGLVLFGGAWWMVHGGLTVGTFFAFLTYDLIVIWPVRHMGRVLADAGKAVVAVRRLAEILEQPEETVADRVPGANPGRLRGALEVRELSFSFNGAGDVLKEISFSIRAGETLALLGHPGSGKSTLVDLLLRLYDYDRGSILLDGKELRSMSRAFVRSQIGVVLQEPFLYAKTIGDNVRTGYTEASHQELVAAATTASIHDAVEDFEFGYDSLVGERGFTLSGGQRQRVSLARALLKDPPILILDDALSAVDTDTEARILERLRDRSANRTTILISHRLSSIVHADRILVLEEGRVVQSGTHAELIGQNGQYRRLWKIQGSLEEEIRRDVLGPEKVV